MAAPAARTTEQRRIDTEAILAGTADTWVATTDADRAHLVPLTFDWNDGRVVIATPERSITARNFVATSHARLAFGGLRDVVMMDAELERVAPIDEPALIEHYAAKGDGDPRTWGEGYAFFVLRPVLIQAWREANEIAGRTLMRDGAWLP